MAQQVTNKLLALLLGTKGIATKGTKGIATNGTIGRFPDVTEPASADSLRGTLF